MRLEGKLALVTGASSGIGKAVAERFAAEGADLCVTALRNVEGLEDTRRRCEAAGRRALALRADVASVSDVEKMVNEAAEGLGGLDILVNSAGVRSVKDFNEVSEEDFDNLLSVNLKGLYFATQFAVPHMEKRGKGKVIHISSVLGQAGIPGYSLYCTAKGAVDAFARQLAVELATKRINVNSLALGPINTEWIQAHYTKNPHIRDAVLANIPTGRLGEVEDAANAAVFLASDESDFVYGHVMAVDGGYIAR